MPRETKTCPRMYRDGLGALRRCDGPMDFSTRRARWTCSWCGRMLTGLYPRH